MNDLKTVTNSLITLKGSIEMLVKTRLARIEASFERKVAELVTRIAKVEGEQKMFASEQKQDIQAVEMRIESRLAALERAMDEKDEPTPPRPRVTKYVERDANGQIKKIVEEEARIS